MAFISEITYAGYGEAAAGEYVEVTLMPGENPADFTLSFYDADGTLHDGASSFFASGEFTLQDIVDAVGGIPGTLTSSVGGLDLQVAYHPDNPAALVFIIPSTLSAGTTTASAETRRSRSSVAILSVWLGAMPSFPCAGNDGRAV